MYRFMVKLCVCALAAALSAVLVGSVVSASADEVPSPAGGPAGEVQPAGASYGEFCSLVTVGPYGQANDNCAGGGFRRNIWVQVQARYHSGCASSTTNGAKSGVNVNWVCTAGGGNEVVVNYVNPNVYTYGIVRNNTTGDSNQLTGVNAFYTSP